MLEVKNLTFTYPGGGKPAVEGISFGVERGEIFGFLGPSGAGKSTTQKILIGLLRGYQGHIEVMGRDLRGWGPEYYERIGVSFELPNHYQKLTALENLDFFRSLYAKPSEDPRELLEMVGARGRRRYEGLPVLQRDADAAYVRESLAPRAGVDLPRRADGGP